MTMSESEMVDIINGKLTEIREIMMEEYRMLGRVAKQVDDVDIALELSDRMNIVGRGLLADDITYRSVFLGNSGGGGG